MQLPAIAQSAPLRGEKRHKITAGYMTGCPATHSSGESMRATTNTRRLMSEELITAIIGRFVDAGSLAGAATLVWQDGQVLQAAGVGWRDMELNMPMERDTLFRIASMTKSFTAAAILHLRDGGKLLAVEGHGNAGVARLYMRNGDDFSGRSLFNCAIQPLPGFERKAEFVL